MNKKIFLLLKFGFVSLLLLFLISACSDNSENSKKNVAEKKITQNERKVENDTSNKSTSSKATDSKSKTSNGELTFYTWANYFPQSVFDKFEKQYGIKVKLITYESELEFDSNYESKKIKYDLASTWNLTTKSILEDGNLAKIDPKNIPNLKYIDEYYRTSFDSNMDYCVPITSGFICLLVNTDIIKEPIKGYKDLWNPKYENKISLIQEEALGIALKKLGYPAFDSDINHLKEASEELKKLKSNIAMFNGNNAHDFVKSGEIGIAQVWSGWPLFESISNKNLQVVYPEEGIDIWIDALSIPKDAKNKKEAELFINFLNNPEINLEFISYAMYATANTEARKLFKVEEYAATSLPLEKVKSASYLEESSAERYEFEEELNKVLTSFGAKMF